MTTPANALTWAEVLDPYDQVDYILDCSQLMDVGETIASFTVTAYAESSLVGLTIGPYSPSVVNNNQIRIWFSVDSNYQSNAAFDGAGSALPVLITFTSSSNPPRRRQRTMVLKVQQR